MAQPNILPGNKFRLSRGGGGSPETFTFVCIATTIDYDRTAEVEDAMLPDCSTPTSIPTRLSTIKGQTEDLSFSGYADPGRLAGIEADWLAGITRNFQLIRDFSGALGGDTRVLAAIITSLKINKSENGMVRFSATLHGQGLAIVTANP
jgi:hypothetical protein